jgi:hypothetical protein
MLNTTIREMSIKSIQGDHVTPVRMALIKKTNYVTNNGQDMEKMEPLHTIGRM